MSHYTSSALATALILFGANRSSSQADHRVASTKSAYAELGSLVADLERDSTRTLNGVLVVRAGHPLLEAYFNGEGPETLHDMRSAGKSITSLLAGIALDRHFIPNVEARLGDLVPALAGTPAGATTLSQYLTMRSGLDANDVDSLSIGNESRMDASSDWLAFAAIVPRKTPPGERYLYASLNAFLVGAAVERAVHEPLGTFANEVLFRPLGITSYQWRRGPRGEGVGQGNLRIRLRDMAKVGELMLHEGMYGKVRVVSSA